MLIARILPTADVTQASTVEAFGKALIRLGERRSDVVAVVCDTLKTMSVAGFAERFPDRTLNFGIAEQNAVMAAAGLATTGKIPYVATYAVFLSMRTLEQLRTFVCYPKLNVKIVAGLGGFSGYPQGPTHFGVEDVSIVRSLANLTVVVPADAVATEKAIEAAADHQGPVYIRTGGVCPVVYDDGLRFEIGRALAVKCDGRDVTIVANGVMVGKALEATALLAKEGIGARVLDVHTVKPLDRQAILDWASATGAVVTAEENNVVGGLGSAVAEVLAEGFPTPLERVGIPDCYGDTSLSYADLLARFGLTAEAIAAAARRAIARKEQGRRDAQLRLA